ncbi:MAG: hypothetical protein LBT26_07480 [Clostridiales Family XIII bacterium]|nr:hypothetical protein [Clostridiales Family XIII bacterium]
METLGILIIIALAIKFVGWMFGGKRNEIQISKEVLDCLKPDDSSFIQVGVDPDGKPIYQKK